MAGELPALSVDLHRLYGGQLCLDFANTVEPRAAQPQRDFLHSYADLVQWARHAGALDDGLAERLLRLAASRPAAAGASLAAAIDLREATYRTFAAVAQGSRPASADLERLQQAYAQAMRHARLRPAADRYSWTWDDDHLDRAWWPMARSAVELATVGPLERVKQCCNPAGCAWLFFDTSRNRVRRWCSMEDCGGKMKTKRQTARRRAARAHAS
jgi:predicted RNA-binding Zn ribbon-like protein